MAEYEIHPAAECFPMMSDAELQELANDIGEHGLREPIMRWGESDGPIIDGRNRLKACEIAGVIPSFHYIHATVCDDPAAYVVSLNLHRRHLTTSQRAMVAGKIANLPRGVRVDRSKDPSTTIPQAATLLNVSEPSVKRAKRVAKHGAPELQEAVQKGDVSVKRASEITMEHKDHGAQVEAMNQPAKKPPAKPDAPANQLPPVSGRKRRTAMAMTIARACVDKLTEIKKTDIERKDAFEHIRKFMETRRDW